MFRYFSISPGMFCMNWVFSTTAVAPATRALAEYSASCEVTTTIGVVAGEESCGEVEDLRDGFVNVRPLEQADEEIEVHSFSA